MSYLRWKAEHHASLFCEYDSNVNTNKQDISSICAFGHLVITYLKSRLRLVVQFVLQNEIELILLHPNFSYYKFFNFLLSSTTQKKEKKKEKE